MLDNNALPLLAAVLLSGALAVVVVAVALRR
jgi:hypothetical protein